MTTKKKLHNNTFNCKTKGLATKMCTAIDSQKVFFQQKERRLEMLRLGHAYIKCSLNKYFLPKISECVNFEFNRWICNKNIHG
jgi:hypothetical protein